MSLDCRVFGPFFSELPWYATATHNGISGNGAGSHDQARIKAIGELVERVHVLEDCTASGRASASTISLGDPVSNADWRRCWEQLGLDVSADMTLLTVPAVAYPARVPVDIPLMHVSLRADAGESSFVDTSGCAAHRTPALASANAIREFIERQYLCAAWLAGYCEFAIDQESMMAACSGGLAQVLKWLRASGQLTLLCLGDEPNFFTAFAFHVATPLTERSAGFSCGCGGSADPVEAVQSAVAELVSGLIFDLSVGVRAMQPTHRYEQNAQRFSFATYRDLLPTRWLQAQIRPLPPRKAKPTCSYNDVLDGFGFAYAVYCESSRFAQGWWVAKVVSPSYFVNIDTGGRINLQNPFFSAYLAARGLPDGPFLLTPHCLP